jgi:quercetin dioxygenase-like cupin family protein
MTIRLEFSRIAPGVRIGPHVHGVETVVYVAGGELVFEHGEDMARRAVVGPGDVLYEAPAELHRIRNDGPLDVLALLAAIDPDPADAAVALRRWLEADEPVRRASGARVTVEGDVRRTFLAEPGDFGSAAFTITEVEIAPGGVTGWHRHPASEHALVMFEGRGTITVGDVEEVLEPLKGIRILPGRRHHIRNEGRHRLRYYVCASPGTDPTVDRVPADAPSRDRDA